MSWHSGTSFDQHAGNAIHSPVLTSPTSETDTQRKRKRSSISTPNNGELDSNGSPTTSKRHQPGVKRACNDCRQQKVRVSLR